MKYTAVSWLGFLLVLPAFAGARLPAVNVSAGAVSARAQYGLPADNSETFQNERPVSVSVVNNTDSVRGVTSKKNVVARTTTTGSNTRTALMSDYLQPNRPSSDLWARSDTPLRMPHANEFSVLTSNETLPEESLGSISNVTKNDEFAELSTRVSALDSRISRLMDMQRRAEESVATRSTKPTVETRIFSPASDVVSSAHDIVKSTESLPARTFVNDAVMSDDNVKLSRLVVSRDDDGQDAITSAARKNSSQKIKEVRNDMKNMTPAELRRAFRKTFLSENKHLSTYPIDDRFDATSDIQDSIEGFTSSRDLSEDIDTIRPLEIKIKFKNRDSALSRENYNLLTEYAGIVVSNPKRAIQIAIPESATETSDGRKLAARRLAIVEQVLRDTGVSENRIVPVLSQREDESLVLRVISKEQYETLTKQTRNKYGRNSGEKTYKSLSW